MDMMTIHRSESVSFVLVLVACGPSRDVSGEDGGTASSGAAESTDTAATMEPADSTLGDADACVRSNDAELHVARTTSG